MDNDRLRELLFKAEDEGVITKEEISFVVTLVERFRRDIDIKMEQILRLTGEVTQLKANEKIIADMVENLMKAAERDKARQETIEKLKNDTPKGG